MNKLYFLFVFDTEAKNVALADKILREAIIKGYRSYNGFFFESDKSLSEIKQLLNNGRTNELIYILLDITDNCSEELLAGFVSKVEFVYAHELVALIKKYRTKNVFENFEELTDFEMRQELDSILDLISKNGYNSLMESQKQRLDDLSQKVGV
jgi:hypothetical protein